MGPVTTRQASLHVTDRSVAHPQGWGARRWASTPPVSRRSRQPATGPPGSYPDRTYTGKRRRAYDLAVNHSHDQPPIYWTHVGSGAGAMTVTGGRSRSLCSCGFPRGCPTTVAMAGVVCFQLPPVKPCMRFSRTRLTDAVHRWHSVFPARACSPWVRRQFRSGGPVRTGLARGRRARTGRSAVRVYVASQ